MLKRISVGILAIIIYGIFLELGERLRFRACTASSPPQRPSSVAR